MCIRDRFKRGSKACVRANFFAELVNNHWNSLPDRDFNYLILITCLLWPTVSALLCLAVRFYCYFICILCFFCEQINGYGYRMVPRTVCVICYALCISGNIDKCAVNNGGCDKFAECNNFPGSYKCTCMTGFIGDGFTCTGVILFT